MSSCNACFNMLLYKCINFVQLLVFLANRIDHPQNTYLKLTALGTLFQAAQS